MCIRDSPTGARKTASVRMYGKANRAIGSAFCTPSVLGRSSPKNIVTAAKPSPATVNRCGLWPKQAPSALVASVVPQTVQTVDATSIVVITRVMSFTTTANLRWVPSFQLATDLYQIKATWITLAANNLGMSGFLSDQSLVVLNPICLDTI